MKFSDHIFSDSINWLDGEKQVLWYGLDSKKLFDSNLTKQPLNSNLLYYKDNPITYKFNSSYFRTPDEFNSVDEGNVFLGCSHTMGSGHHLDNVWSYKVNKEIGGKFWNLALGGTGPMTAFRLFMHFIDKLKVKNVFVFLPHVYRYEFRYKDRWIKLTPSAPNVEKLPQLFKDVLYEDYTAFMMINFVVKSLAYECGKRNINFYFDNIYPDPLIHTSENVNTLENLQARDLVHLSVYQQSKVAKKFMNLYNSGKTFNKIEQDIDLLSSGSPTYTI